MVGFFVGGSGGGSMSGGSSSRKKGVVAFSSIEITSIVSLLGSNCIQLFVYNQAFIDIARVVRAT